MTVLIAYFKRYFGYAFWVALEMLIFIGLPRLVVYPLVAHLLGKEEFGLFLFAIGIVMMLGKAPSTGLETGVIRHLASLDKSEGDMLVATGVCLCRRAMLVIVAVGLSAIGVVRYFWQTNPKIIWCLLPLILLLYSWNLFELQMVRYRVERRFALRTAWYGLLGILLFITVPSAVFGGVVGMAWGYMFAFMLAYIILSWKQKVLLKKTHCVPELASLLKQIWLHMSIASILVLSSRYVYRVILGVLHSYSDVSIFFGATNIIDLSLAPIALLGQLVLSILGGFTNLADIGKKQLYAVLGVAVSIAVGAGMVVFYIGPFILSLIFPEFAAESEQILRIIVVVVPFATVIHFSRPFVVKFGPIKCIGLLNLINLGAHLLPAMILVPRLGVKGAAISYSIGYGLSAFSWLIAFVWVLRLSRSSEVEITKDISSP